MMDLRKEIAKEKNKAKKQVILTAYLIIVAFIANAQISIRSDQVYEYTYQDKDRTNIDGFIWFDSLFFYQQGSFNTYYDNWSLLTQDSQNTEESQESFWKYLRYDLKYRFLLKKEKNYLINKYANAIIFPLKKSEIISSQSLSLSAKNFTENVEVRVKLIQKNYTIEAVATNFKCYVFEISEIKFHTPFYPLTAYKTKWTYYIDKKTLLPIRIHSYIITSDSTASEYNETLTRIIKMPPNIR